MNNINLGAHFLFLPFLYNFKIKRLLFLKFLKNYRVLRLSTGCLQKLQLIAKRERRIAKRKRSSSSHVFTIPETTIFSRNFLCSVFLKWQKFCIEIKKNANICNCFVYHNRKDTLQPFEIWSKKYFVKKIRRFVN